MGLQIAVRIILMNRRYQHMEQVRTENGLGLAEYWSCPSTECSAKSTHNVNTVFAETVREMNYVQNARIKQNQGRCIVL